jgi:hypothetical protein
MAAKRSAARRSSTRRTSAKRSSSASTERTKEQLYREAKRLKVEGRSKMNKQQLKRAISRAR